MWEQARSKVGKRPMLNPADSFKFSHKIIDIHRAIKVRENITELLVPWGWVGRGTGTADTEMGPEGRTRAKTVTGVGSKSTGEEAGGGKAKCKARVISGNWASTARRMLGRK